MPTRLEDAGTQPNRFSLLLLIGCTPYSVQEQTARSIILLFLYPLLFDGEKGPFSSLSPRFSGRSPVLHDRWSFFLALALRLRRIFPQRQKGNANARPFGLPSSAPSTTRKKVVAAASRGEGACRRAGEKKRASCRHGMNSAPVKILYRGRADDVCGDEGPGARNVVGTGRGNDPASWGKAAAHALRAAAAQPACRGPLPQGNPARCCATIAARVGPPPA